MKTTIKILLSLFAVTLFLWACSSNDDTAQMMDDVLQTDDVDPTNDDSSNQDFTTSSTEISVVLPEGTDLDLTSSKLVILGQDYDISAQGSATVPIFEEGWTYLKLINVNEEVILMGFVSKNQPILDVKAAVIATFYFGFGTVFGFDEAKREFLNRAREEEFITPYVNQLKELISTSSTALGSPEFTNWITAAVSQIRKTRDNLDIGNNILVTDNTIRSGVTVIQDENDIFSANVLNFGRRRAYAMFHQTGIKYIGSEEFTIENENFVLNDRVAEKKLQISPITGLTSIQGATLDIMMGNGMDVGFKLNGPVPLPLTNDNEQAVKYMARIIGPSARSNEFSFTSEEKELLTKLKIETFALDVIIPVVTTLVGFKDFDDSNDIINIDPIVQSISFIVANSTNVADALDDGDFKTATVELFKAIIANVPGTETFWEVLIDYLEKKGFKGVGAADLAKRLVGPLNVVNAILTSSDAVRVLYELNNSNELEEFEFIVTRGKVKIDPKITGIAKGDQATFSSKILDDENIEPNEYQYEWSSSIEFGSIEPMNNDMSKAIYISDDFLEIPPEGAQEKVYLSVLKNGNLVGKDSSLINIYPTKYRIVPRNPTIDGDDSVTFYVVDAENNRISDDKIDIEVNWETTGNHGNFEGSAVSGLGDLKDTSIEYQAFDQETIDGTDKIIAKVYFNSPTSGKQYLVSELETSVNINNDENKKSFTLSEQVYEVNSGTDSGGNSWIDYHNGFVIPYDPNAKEYSMEILEYRYRRNNDEPCPCTGNVIKWTNDPNTHNQANIRFEGGKYWRGIAGVRIFKDSDHEADLWDHINSYYGEVLITKTLED